jgi:Rrf2 family protein
LALSAKVRYGIVALIELAAIHAQGGVLQVGEIAQRQSIPDRYLEQMLTTLRRARILRSIRGPKGGFQLARPPAEVPLLEVVAALEGESRARDLTARTTPEFEVLTTLEDLLEERDQRLQAQVMYFI